MRKLYKNGMNMLQKGLVIMGATSVLLGYSTTSTAAFYPFVCPRSLSPQPCEMPQLKYYRLDMSNCKDCPDWLREDVASPATLSNEEFEQMKAVLQKSITRYNLKTQGNPNFQITGQYGVQCLPYLNKKGQKQIWINGFCEDDKMYQKPETEIVIALDGGNCFFGTLIRSGSRKTVSIGIHGFG